MSNQPKSTSWALAPKVAVRLQKAKGNLKLDQKLAIERFNIRCQEILELGRPDDAPEEAVFDGKDFCLPEDLPDGAKRALGIVVTPDSPRPQPSTAEDKVVDSIGG